MKIGKILALICVFCFSLNMVAFAAADKNVAAVSPALNIISSESHVAMSCVADKTLSFDAEDFERALNLSYVSSITVTKLPEKSDGILYLGSSEVSEGQTISRGNIGFLNFEFSDESNGNSQFCFSTVAGGHEIKCRLYSLKYENNAPLHRVNRYEQVSTYKNVSLYGKLDAYDAEGDRMIYELVKAPDNGILKLSSDGEYSYSPTSGFVGDDSFKYVVQDEYGNYSTLREVNLNVEMQSSSLVFSDLADERYHVAAINLTEKGITSAQEVDGKFFFHPKAELGRLEYLVMAMKNLGIKAENDGAATVFADDAQIADGLKGYVNTAVSLGIVSGRINENGEPIFAPNDKITKAEAAVMLNNMANLDMPVMKPMLADSDATPSWAEEAVFCLVYHEVIPNNNGFVSANSLLCKDEGAYMLYMLGQINSAK